MSYNPRSHFRLAAVSFSGATLAVCGGLEPGFRMAAGSR